MSVRKQESNIIDLTLIWLWFQQKTGRWQESRSDPDDLDPMPDIYSAGKSPGKVANELFTGWMRFEGIGFDTIEDSLRLFLEA